MRGGRRSWQLCFASFSCLISLVTSGCSFLFAQGPPRDHREKAAFDCTLDVTAPTIDSVLAVTGGASTLFLFLLSGLSDTTDPRPKIALLSIPFFFLPAGSAVYGISQVHSCRAAKVELLARPELPSVVPSAVVAAPTGGGMGLAVAAAPCDVRTAPYLVAPVLTHLISEQQLLVSHAVTNGWRAAALPDGRMGYIEDTQVLLKTTAADR